MCMPSCKTKLLLGPVGNKIEARNMTGKNQVQ